MFNDIMHLLTNTEPVNRHKIKSTIDEMYGYCGLHSPEIFFVDGPNQLFKEMDPDEEPAHLEHKKDTAHFVTRRGMGQQEKLKNNIYSLLNPLKEFSSALLLTDFEYNSNGKWEQLATDIWNESIFVINFKKRSYVVDNPKTILFNKHGLHCEDGPAITFRDGSEFFFWNGQQVTEQQLLNPESMTLDEIHDGNSRKHILIALAGVDHYLDLCNSWKPDVSGKFEKFFSFSKMVIPGDELIEKSWNRKGRGHMYVDKPYSVTITKGSVNNKYGTLFKHNTYQEFYHFENDIFDGEYQNLFHEQDRELWKTLRVQEMMRRGPLSFDIRYQKVNEEDVFSLVCNYEDYPRCSHDVAPAWFKAKMFLGEDATYINEDLGYAVKYENGKLLFSDNVEFKTGINKDDGPLVFHNPLFSGFENIPFYKFHLNLTSNTWEGLLEQWSYLSFNWLATHEDSTRMP